MPRCVTDTQTFDPVEAAPHFEDTKVQERKATRSEDARVQRIEPLP